MEVKEGMGDSSHPSEGMYGFQTFPSLDGKSDILFLKHFLKCDRLYTPLHLRCEGIYTPSHFRRDPPEKLTDGIYNLSHRYNYKVE